MKVKALFYEKAEKNSNVGMAFTSGNHYVDSVNGVDSTL